MKVARTVSAPPLFKALTASQSQLSSCRPELSSCKLLLCQPIVTKHLLQQALWETQEIKRYFTHRDAALCKLTEKEHGPTTQDSKFSEREQQRRGRSARRPHPRSVYVELQREGASRKAHQEKQQSSSAWKTTWNLTAQGQQEANTTWVKTFETQC